MGRFLTAALALYSFILIKTNIASLPARIPTHFNAAGEANGWGSPNTLWFTLLIQVVTCGVILTVPFLGRRFPGLVHVGFRKLSDFTPEQQKRIMPLLKQMGDYMSVVMSLLFAFLIYEMIRAASSSDPRISIGWTLVVFLGSNATILIYFMRRINGFTRQDVAGRE
jgi:uncharacterized membrane protein